MTTLFLLVPSWKNACNSCTLIHLSMVHCPPSQWHRTIGVLDMWGYGIHVYLSYRRYTPGCIRLIFGNTTRSRKCIISPDISTDHSRSLYSSRADSCVAHNSSEKRLHRVFTAVNLENTAVYCLQSWDINRWQECSHHIILVADKNAVIISYRMAW